MNTTTIKHNNKDHEIRSYGSNVEIWCDHERKEVIYWDDIAPDRDEEFDTVGQYCEYLIQFYDGELPFTVYREAIRYAFGSKIADTINSREMCFCKSYANDDRQIVDCTCGKCSLISKNE